MCLTRTGHSLSQLFPYPIVIDIPRRNYKNQASRQRRRLVDNIKMDLREIGWNGMDWIDVAQDRNKWRALVNTVMNLRFP
jgi:uncharacterized NAD(P)/FAD-binding protein YdhS